VCKKQRALSFGSKSFFSRSPAIILVFVVIVLSLTTMKKPDLQEDTHVQKCYELLSNLLQWQVSKSHIFRVYMGNESVPKVIINNAINLFIKTAISILVISNRNMVFECCLIKLLSYVSFDKYIYIFAVEMASPVNQHYASCIGTSGAARIL